MTNTSIIRSRILELLKESWPKGMTDAELSKSVPASKARVARVRLKLKKGGFVRPLENLIGPIKRDGSTVWLVCWNRIDDETESVRRSLHGFDQATRGSVSRWS